VSGLSWRARLAVVALSCVVLALVALVFLDAQPPAETVRPEPVPVTVTVPPAPAPVPVPDSRDAV
jgi:hypothetical protein